MSEETGAQARLSRALAQEDRRYQRALKTAKKLSKDELEKTAVHLLMRLMVERAFTDRFDEVKSNYTSRSNRRLQTEHTLYRAATMVEAARRAKGGNSKAAKNAVAREEVRSAWAKTSKRGRGTKTRFVTDQAAKYKVSPRTIENWLKQAIPKVLPASESC